MDVTTVIINYSVSDSPQRGNSGPGSALPLPLSSMALAEIILCQRWGDKNGARGITPPKEEGLRAGLVFVSWTRPIRRFWPLPLPLFAAAAATSAAAVDPAYKQTRADTKAFAPPPNHQKAAGH